jgi:hypothetical protein
VIGIEKEKMTPCLGSHFKGLKNLFVRMSKTREILIYFQ